MPLNMTYINNFTYPVKKWISQCDDHTRDHTRKQLAQSGHSTQSVLYIFNTLRIFTNEPIGEQEMKLGCMI